MLKSVEIAVATFTQLAVVCTFGLAVVIGVAGVTKTKSPLACNSCGPVIALATTPIAG